MVGLSQGSLQEMKLADFHIVNTTFDKLANFCVFCLKSDQKRPPKAQILQTLLRLRVLFLSINLSS